MEHTDNGPDTNPLLLRIKTVWWSGATTKGLSQNASRPQELRCLINTQTGRVRQCTLIRDLEELSISADPVCVQGLYVTCRSISVPF